MKENIDYVTVELLKCNHCQEYHTDTKENMQEHLTECVANPENKACLMCDHIRMHNAIDKENGRPLTYYTCKNREQFLMEEDLRLMGAECFENRGYATMDKVNSDEYMEYLENLVGKIKKTM